jgi:integrase
VITPRERGYEPWPDYGNYTDYLTPLVLVALNTGLRRGEMLQLRWRDVDLARNVLTVRGEGAKTGQTRHVPLNTEVAQVLTNWKPTAPEADRFVFSSNGVTTPLTEARKARAGAIAKAKIRSFRCHDLRHTFGSKLVMAGVDLNTVRELLGHRKISMTLRYAHLAPQHKADAVENSSPALLRQPNRLRASPEKAYSDFTFRRERQSHRHASPGTRPGAVRFNRPAMQLHETPHDRQTEAEALARR